MKGIEDHKYIFYLNKKILKEETTRKEAIIHQTMTYFKDSEKALNVLSNYLKDKPFMNKIVDN